MSDGDAKFLIKEFVMPALTETNKKLDKVIECQTNLKIEDEKLRSANAKNELLLTQTQDAFLKHCNDMDRHFNPYYSETIPQKIWRKKPEILTGVSLSSIAATVIYLLIQKYSGG
jgi:hypothetical protein